MARAERDRADTPLTERGDPMDNLKDMAGQAGNQLGGLQDQLKGINFPINKSDLVSQLEQKGVPSQVTDKLRNSDTEQFSSQEDVLSKVQGMF